MGGPLSGNGGRMSSSPFLLPDHPDYAEILTDGAVHVLETRGVDRFSVAAIARWMKVTPVAVNNHYSRARLLDVVTIRFAQRWLRWTVGYPFWLRSDHPCPLRLPSTAEERHGVVVLQALGELARGERVMGNPLPMHRIAQLRKDEAELLASRVSALNASDVYRPVAEDRLSALMALLSGLRSALADDPPRLRWETARDQFSQAAIAVAGSEPDAPSRMSDPNPQNEPAA